MNQHRYDKAYMKVAHIFGELSFDTKHRVGSIIVRDGQVLSQGWNGMPAGMDNMTRNSFQETKLEVIHSEANEVSKDRWWLSWSNYIYYTLTLYGVF